MNTDPFVLAVLCGLLFLPLYYLCLRPLEYYNQGLRFPVTALCFLQTISLFSKENNLTLWFISLLQCMIIWILVDNFATQHHLPSSCVRDDYGMNGHKKRITSTPTISLLNGSMWIKTHMILCYTHPITILVTCLHLLDVLFIWDPRSTYTKNNDYDIIGTLYNAIHIIMFITFSWQKYITRQRQEQQHTGKEKPVTANGTTATSRAFFVYNFVVGLQPARSIIRAIIICPYRPNSISWQESILYFLSSVLAAMDTLPALILLYYNVSSETELVSFVKKHQYNESENIADNNNEEDGNHVDGKEEKSRMLMTERISTGEVPVYDPNVLTTYY
ncbi:hypothetical protein BDA99DRAFT_520244 [Phascolomyces articulosus]|uniref:Uncharacterized protein n=1 Tax=Phascolomyces articulosus TaxID=60185 RepID=A0AAD5PAN0_9FUNG|nr:hypothetical protein BDA99DRAFT_520244 [Phascolomyces articulosus]